MFSGKTDALIDAYLAAKEEGVRPIAFKPQIDNRHPARVIRSHSNREIPATPAVDTTRLLRTHAEYVLIDEAQFFDASLGDAVEELRDRGSRIFVAGLDRDFARRPFEVTEALIQSADIVERRMSVCGRCGLPAPFTQRFVDGKPAPLDARRFLVGDEECYEPRCERCWFEERASVFPA